MEKGLSCSYSDKLSISYYKATVRSRSWHLVFSRLRRGAAMARCQLSLYVNELPSIQTSSIPYVQQTNNPTDSPFKMQLPHDILPNPNPQHLHISLLIPTNHTTEIPSSRLLRPCHEPLLLPNTIHTSRTTPNLLNQHPRDQLHLLESPRGILLPRPLPTRLVHPTALI